LCTIKRNRLQCLNGFYKLYKQCTQQMPPLKLNNTIHFHQKRTITEIISFKHQLPNLLPFKLQSSDGNKPLLIRQNSYVKWFSFKSDTIRVGLRAYKNDFAIYTLEFIRGKLPFQPVHLVCKNVCLSMGRYSMPYTPVHPYFKGILKPISPRTSPLIWLLLTQQFNWILCCCSPPFTMKSRLQLLATTCGERNYKLPNDSHNINNKNTDCLADRMTDRSASEAMSWQRSSLSSS